MSLRDLPSSERAFALAVLLTLVLGLGLGLTSVFHGELKPTSGSQLPPARSRLMAVLEGVMAPNVSPAETARFASWVATGATREGFPQVEAVVANNCASCHGQGGQFPRIDRFEDLRALALEATPTGLLGMVDPRTLHLFLFPLLFLVAAGGYLRRTAWPGRTGLLGICALVVAFDAGQWWLRQGRPEALGAAWAGSVALAAAMAALLAVVLRDLLKTETG